MKKLLAAISVILGLSALPASAAVILTQNTSTSLVCAFELRCVASAQLDFVFPTFNYVLPMFAAGPQTEAFVPPHYTYRIVISAPEAPIATVAHTYFNYYEDDFLFYNGTFHHAGGGDYLNKDFMNCDLDGYCDPSGYTHNSQSIFTFDDGLWTSQEILTDYPYYNGYRLNLLAGWTGGASVAAFFDPALEGMPVTIQVLQFSAVPEPSTWAILIVGFGFCGAMLRRTRRAALPSIA